MKDKGFTLFIAIIITGTLLLISTGIVTLALKQSLVANSGKESQHAFYAADTGMECALYCYSAFSTTTSTLISCNKNGINDVNEWWVGGNAVSVINYITFLPDPYCAIVTVTKNVDGTTQIESKGYNTCDGSATRRVERAVRATY